MIKNQNISVSTFICLIIFILIIQICRADDITDKGWIKKYDKDEVKTYIRNTKCRTTAELMMIGTMDAAPSECFEVVTDYHNFSKFMPFVEYSKVLHSIKENENKASTYVFFYISTPIFCSRYYTIKLTDEKKVDGKKDTYRSRWELENGYYHKTPNDPDIKSHIKTGWQIPVETVENQGYWLFTPLPSGKKTHVNYYALINPGGSVPPLLANEGNTVGLPMIWKAIKKQLALKKKRLSSQ